MAHQTHALPWNTLASHLKYMYSHTHEPKRKDIFPLHKENQEKEVDYFCRTFAQRVREFADTERAKFAPQETYKRRARTWTESAPDRDMVTTTPPRGPERRTVYPRPFLARYFGSGADGQDGRLWYRHGEAVGQNVSRWAEDNVAGAGVCYADMLKLMMIEAAGAPPALTASPSTPEAAPLRHHITETLLLLANHPETNLLGLVELHHGHHFGLSRVAEEGVRAYVYVNLLIALQERGSEIGAPATDENGVQDPARPIYRDLLTYRQMLDSVAGTYDGDTQNLIHWDFFLPRTEDSWDLDTPKDILADKETLVEYLKGVWRNLVIYDMVIREAGGDSELESRCKFALNASFDMKMDVY